MPNLADISLIVIAASCAAAGVAFAAAVLQAWRTARRAEALLAHIGQDLPGLIADMRGLVARLDDFAEALNVLAGAVERLDDAAERAARAAEEAGSRVRRTMRRTAVTALANVAGAAAAAGETMRWIRRSRNGDRRHVSRECSGGP